MKVSVLTPSIRPQYLQMAQECLARQTNQEFEWLVELGMNNSKEWGLPADWNKMLRRAQGDIIVAYQDCITIPDDAIEKILTLNFEKKAYTFPIGHPQRPDEEPSWDWRKYRETVIGKARLTANQWELDLAAAPRSLFFEVGGFDEDFCKGWSWENVEIGWRAEAAGYEFYVSQVTHGIAIEHDKILEHPFRNKLPNNDKRAARTMHSAASGKYKLSFL